MFLLKVHKKINLIVRKAQIALEVALVMSLMIILFVSLIRITLWFLNDIALRQRRFEHTRIHAGNKKDWGDDWWNRCVQYENAYHILTDDIIEGYREKPLSEEWVFWGEESEESPP